MYYIYLLRCRDDSLYCGTARDYRKRVREHLTRSPRAARYTLSHGAEQLVGVWSAPDSGTALRMEYRVKQLTHAQKEQLLRSPALWSELLPELAECGINPADFEPLSI